MSPYLLLFLITALCALIGFNHKSEPFAFGISFVLGASFLTFRYGQGTDWLSYNYLFVSAPNSFDFDNIYYTDAFHSEFGWKVINNACKVAGVSFISLSMVCSIVEMLLLNRFISTYSSNRASSMLIAMPVTYFIYFFSALRPGLVIAIFLGIMIPLLENRKYLLYGLLTLVVSLLHSAALLFLFLPLVTELKTKQMNVLIAGSVCIAVVAFFSLDRLVAVFGITYETAGISWVALIYRLIMFSLVCILYSGKGQPSTSQELLFKIYVAGFCVYLILSSNQLLSSRLAAPFLAVEAALIPSLLIGQSKQGTILFLCVIALCSVMYTKNISTSIEQGSYVAGVTTLNYPYISVFNQDDIYMFTNSKYLIYLNWK